MVVPHWQATGDDESLLAASHGPKSNENKYVRGEAVDTIFCPDVVRVRVTASKCQTSFTDSAVNETTTA
jgi:hypothetical protein